MKEKLKRLWVGFVDFMKYLMEEKKDNPETYLKTMYYKNRNGYNEEE